MHIGCNNFADKVCWIDNLNDFAQQTTAQYVSWHRYGNSGCSKKTTLRTLLADPVPNDPAKGYDWVDRLARDLPPTKQQVCRNVWKIIPKNHFYQFFIEKL